MVGHQIQEQEPVPWASLSYSLRSEFGGPQGSACSKPALDPAEASRGAALLVPFYSAK